MQQIHSSGWLYPQEQVIPYGASPSFFNLDYNSQKGRTWGSEAADWVLQG